MKRKSPLCSTGHGTGVLMPMDLKDQLRPIARIKQLHRRVKKHQERLTSGSRWHDRERDDLPLKEVKSEEVPEAV